jgi:hypothetical protein
LRLWTVDEKSKSSKPKSKSSKLSFCVKTYSAQTLSDLKMSPTKRSDSKDLPLKKQKLLHEKAKKVTKQSGREYVCTVNAEKRRVQRNAAALRRDAPVATGKSVDSFFKSLKVAHGKGCLAAMSFVAKNITVELSLFRAKLTKQKGKEIYDLGLSRHVNKNSHSLTLANVKATHEGTQYHIMYHAHELLTIKASTLRGANLGIFAARDYNKGSIVAMYCGKSIGATKQKVNDMVIRTWDEGEDLWKALRKESWMGVHFMNDPNLGVRSDRKKKKNVYNVEVEHNLLVKAIADIKKGDELFLDYDMTTI